MKILGLGRSNTFIRANFEIFKIEVFLQFQPWNIIAESLEKVPQLQLPDKPY